MNRVEKNKLIAEFTGAVQSYKPYAPNEDMEFHMYDVIECIEDGPDEQHYFLHDDMQFDTDWRWLMSVVDRIESLGFTVRIESEKDKLNVVTHLCFIWEDQDSDYVAASQFMEKKLECVYETILDFIKWHNQNK